MKGKEKADPLRLSDHDFTAGRDVGPLLWSGETSEVWREAICLKLCADQSKNPVYFRPRIKKLMTRILTSYGLNAAEMTQKDNLQNFDSYSDTSIMKQTIYEISHYLASVLKAHENLWLPAGVEEKFKTRILHGYKFSRKRNINCHVKENVPGLLSHAIQQVGKFILLNKLYAKHIGDPSHQNVENPLLDYIYNNHKNGKYHGEAFLHYMNFSHQTKSLIAMGFRDRQTISGLNVFKIYQHAIKFSNLIIKTENTKKGFRILACQSIFDKTRSLPDPILPDPFIGFSDSEVDVITCWIAKCEYFTSKVTMSMMQSCKTNWDKSIHVYETAAKELSGMPQWREYCQKRNQDDPEERDLVKNTHRLLYQLKWLSMGDSENHAICEMIVNFFLKDAQTKTLEQCSRDTQDIFMLYVFIQEVSKVLCHSVDGLSNPEKSQGSIKISQFILYFWSFTRPCYNILDGLGTKAQSFHRFELGSEYRLYLKLSDNLQSFFKTADKEIPSRTELYTQSLILKRDFHPHKAQQDNVSHSKSVLEDVSSSQNSKMHKIYNPGLKKKSAQKNPVQRASNQDFVELKQSEYFSVGEKKRKIDPSPPVPGGLRFVNPPIASSESKRAHVATTVKFPSQKLNSRNGNDEQSIVLFGVKIPVVSTSSESPEESHLR